MKRLNRQLSALLFLFLSLNASESYQFTNPACNPGFFCLFNGILGALKSAEKNDKIVEVNFGDQGLYYDSERGLNWFRYYVDSTSEALQISGSDTEYEEIATKLNIKKTLIPNYQKFDYSSAIQFCSDRNKVHDLIERHLAIKPEITNQVDTFVENNFGNDSYVVGVHYRGTDKKIEAAEVAYAEVCKKIRSAISGIKTEQPIKLFVSTDDDRFFTYVKHQFPHNIIEDSSTRSTDGKPVHYNMSMNGYKKGEEALTASLKLSRCHMLIKMASNLSDFSAFINPRMPITHLNESFSQQRSGNMGIFRVIHGAIALCKKMQYQHQVPQLVYDNDGKYYDESRGANWIDYFFERKKNPELEAGKNFATLRNYKKDALANRALYELPRSEKAAILKELLSVRDDIIEEVNEVRDQKFKDSYIIGVDYHASRERYINPKVSVKKIVDTIRCAMSHTQKPCKVFVSTNNALFALDIERELSDKAVRHYVLTEEQEVPFQAEKRVGYMDGRCSLVTCLLLAKSDHIISTGSHLSATAEIFNPKAEVTRLEENWLNQ